MSDLERLTELTLAELRDDFLRATAPAHSMRVRPLAIFDELLRRLAVVPQEPRCPKCGSGRLNFDAEAKFAGCQEASCLYYTNEGDFAQFFKMAVPPQEPVNTQLLKALKDLLGIVNSLTFPVCTTGEIYRAEKAIEAAAIPPKPSPGAGELERLRQQYEQLLVRTEAAEVKLARIWMLYLEDDAQAQQIKMAAQQSAAPPRQDGGAK